MDATPETAKADVSIQSVPYTDRGQTPSALHPSPAPEVQSSIERLAGAQDRLHAVITRLEDRLAPVLRPTTENPSNVDAAPTGVEIADNIDVIRYNLEMRTERLNAVIDRLGI